MKLLCSLLFLLFSCTWMQSYSQKSTSNESSYKGFVKWILDQREERMVAIAPVQLDIGMIKKVSDKIKYSKKDLSNIQKQIDLNNKTVFDSTLTSSKRFMNEADIVKTSTLGNFLYVKISKPIFINNRIFIVVERYCGMECGHGEIQVYQANKSSYSLVYRERTWIS